jgi:hypothetical protein
MSADIAARLRGSPLIPSIETDLQVVHGLAAELRDIAHDHARHDGFVKFSGTRWMSYYHSLDRILMEHDRRQAEIYKYADEIERLRAERDEARREVCDMEGQTAGGALLEARKRGWDCFKEDGK